MNEITDLVGYDVHVWYGNPEDDCPPWQVEGVVIGVTPEAVEGQFLILAEDEHVSDDPDFGWHADYRVFPLEWVEQVNVKEEQ